MAVGIVLIEPEIPQNTGNIVRTCAATGAGLHLVGKLGFSTEDRYLKRAGLDYWDKTKVRFHESIDKLYEGAHLEHPGAVFYYATKKAACSYTDIVYIEDNIYLVFGCETRGLNDQILNNNTDKLIRIPMLEGIRSLNLSNAVAIVLYEVLRQKGFYGLDRQFME